MIVFLFCLQMDAVLNDVFQYYNTSDFVNAITARDYSHIDNYHQYVLADNPEKIFLLNLECEFVIGKTFFIGGNAKTTCDYKLGDTSFDVLGMDYTFKAGLRLLDDALEIGYLHDCNHPIQTWRYYYSDHFMDQSFEYAANKIYVAVKGKVTL
jgi:hypothetical protein